MTSPSIAQSIDVASRLQRLAAQFLDGLVAGAPAIAAILFMFLLPRTGIVLILVAGLFGALYTLFADGLEGGQSIGKRLVGIRVVSMETGTPCTFGQSFVRNLLLMILGPIDWIFIFGERHQRLGDKAAGTPWWSIDGVRSPESGFRDDLGTPKHPEVIRVPDPGSRTPTQLPLFALITLARPTIAAAPSRVFTGFSAAVV